ncbi:MAG: V4R domain-containing protein [Longimicrobiales bacterium]
MSPTTSRQSEVALPAAALVALRNALVAELGADAAARVLRAAGHEAGDAFFQILAKESDSGAGRDALADLDEAAFWKRFNQLFSGRGWGSFAHANIHPGVATLSASDCAEAGAGGTDARPSCHFMTGILANILGKAAGGDVAVLEVECRSRGDAECRFLFGSPEALRGVYDNLLHGENAETAVTQLA